MLGEAIVVNDFMFCLDHGDEFCHHCFCDHRLCNNVRIEDELGDMSEFLFFAVEERQPLNAYVRGAVPAIDTEESYQCEKHKTVDCGKCFNWVELIRQEAKRTEEQGRGMWMSDKLKVNLTTARTGESTSSATSA